MSGINPSYLSIPLEFNNNASKTVHYSHCYGSTNKANVMASGFSGFCPDSISMNKSFVNRTEPPFECKVGCNVSNLATTKLAPIQCAQLNQSINDQATQLRLRSELPHLARKDVDEVRLPFYQLLSQELLANGYHYAFSEMFALHQQQNEERRMAGPESALWYIPPLSEQKDKIRPIAIYLAEAESAARRRDAHTVFTSYLTLGLKFEESPDDLWLAEHFFRKALEAARLITDDDGLKLAIANRRYGMILQMRGFLDQASEILVEFYKATRGKLWKDDDGRTLEKLATMYLVENYQLRIDKCAEEYHSDRIELCRRAHDIAMECGDWNLIAPVWLRLGDLLFDASRLDEAYNVYRGLFDKACLRGDYQSLTKVCEALAKISQRMNNMDESIKYLQKFANSCERHGQWIELGRACQMLGTAYDQVGDYASALKWMKKSYTLPQMIQGMKQDECKETVEASRIMIGVTRAHLMHDRYCKKLLQNTPPTVRTLIDWKARPKDEDQLFSVTDTYFPSISFDTRKPKRNVLEYAKHPATGFLYRQRYGQ